jgi:glucose-1-phosphate cytidylyltransferase
MSNFGLIDLNDDNSVARFREKPKLKEWINGGFFVFNREIFDYLEEDSVLEREPFERLAADGNLMAFRHGGFWKCMDTFKDNVELNDIWNSGAPWKVW